MNSNKYIFFLKQDFTASRHPPLSKGAIACACVSWWHRVGRSGEGLISLPLAHWQLTSAVALPVPDRLAVLLALLGSVNRVWNRPPHHPKATTCTLQPYSDIPIASLPILVEVQISEWGFSLELQGLGLRDGKGRSYVLQPMQACSYTVEKGSWHWFKLGKEKLPLTLELSALKWRIRELTSTDWFDTKINKVEERSGKKRMLYYRFAFSIQRLATKVNQIKKSGQ